MSVGGGAATTASSRRSGSSPVGLGLLTSTSTNRTGAPRRSLPTGRWRGRAQLRPWYPRRRDRCRYRDTFQKSRGWGYICIEGFGPLTKRRRENSADKDWVWLILLDICSEHFSSSIAAAAAVCFVYRGEPGQTSCTSVFENTCKVRVTQGGNIMTHSTLSACMQSYCGSSLSLCIRVCVCVIERVCVYICLPEGSQRIQT